MEHILIFREVAQVTDGLDYHRIGRRIRRGGKMKGWSQERLARECGISLSFMGILSGEYGV